MILIISLIDSLFSRNSFLKRILNLLFISKLFAKLFFFLFNLQKSILYFFLNNFTLLKTPYAHKLLQQKDGQTDTCCDHLSVVHLRPPGSKTTMCPLKKIIMIIRHCIYIRTVCSQFLLHMQYAVQLFPSWLVWSINQKYCACAMPKSINQLKLDQ